MRIGIYGGSFDPPHYGHKKIAEFVTEKLSLDKLLIVPVGIASHGKNNLTSSADRMKMCEMTFRNIKNVCISSIEIDMEGVSYTYKTLEAVMKNFGEDNEYFEIIGEDSANYFDKWKEYEKILELSTVVVLRRKGFKNIVNSSKIVTVDNSYFDISSTEIKEKIKNGEDVSDFLDKETEKFIKEKKLYK